MRSRKNSDLPKNLYAHKRPSGVIYYKYVNPQCGQTTPMGTDRNKAIEAAKQLNNILTEEGNLVARVLDPREQLFADVIDEYITQEVPVLPWDTDTRKNNIYKLKKLKREMGNRLIKYTDRLFLADWLNLNCISNDVYMKYRERLVDLYEFAISRKYIEYNEAAAIRKRSLSKKLPQNQKQRSILTLSQYKAIYKISPPFLQIAMGLSLITLQARSEIVNMRYADEREGYLYVIRDKTSGDSDMAFIRIRVTHQLKAIVKQSRLDGVVSPYIVHYIPEYRRRYQIEAKPHWTALLPAYLTRQFQTYRDKVDLFNDVPTRKRPTFHEIRGLGSRLYKDLGYNKAYIQSLMTHSDPKTTDIYLSGGELRDDHFHKVNADLNLAKLLKS